MLHIECQDGLPTSVKITDKATGENVLRDIAIEKIVITMTVGDIVRAEFTPRLFQVGPEGLVSGLAVDLDNVEYRAINPVTKKVEALSAFVFQDGTQVDFLPDGTFSTKPAAVPDDLQLQIARLELKPGDVLVVQTILTSAEQLKRCHDHVQRIVGTGNPVLVLDRDTALSTLTPSPAQELKRAGPDPDLVVTISRYPDGQFSAFAAVTGEENGHGLSKGDLGGAIEFARERLTA